MPSSGAGGGQANSAGINGSLNSTLSCAGPGIRVLSPVACRDHDPRHLESPGAMIRDCIGQAGIRAHMPAEELILVGSLVRTRVDHGSRPAGSDHNQRHVGVPGLQHRGCRLAGAVPEVVSTATGAPDPLASPRAKKARSALVDSYVQPQQPDPVGLEALVRQRRASRAGASTTSRTPRVINSSTITRAHAVALPTGQLPSSARDEPARTCTSSALGRYLSSADLVDDQVAHGDHSVDRDQRLLGQVIGEQSHRVEPARVRQLGQGCGEGKSCPDADRCLQSARHHDG